MRLAEKFSGKLITFTFRDKPDKVRTGRVLGYYLEAATDTMMAQPTLIVSNERNQPERVRFFDLEQLHDHTGVGDVV